MAHNCRCEEANPKTKCRCSCGGRLHGIAHAKYNDDAPWRAINPSLGGEVKRTLEIFDNVPFKCTCGHTFTLTKFSFLGYEHEGGLADDKGNKWWVFFECGYCNYQWSWHKLANRVTQQKQL